MKASNKSSQQKRTELAQLYQRFQVAARAMESDHAYAIQRTLKFQRTLEEQSQRPDDYDTRRYT